MAISVAVSSCGLTPVQKQQVGQFATATESVSTTTQEQFISMRDKVIEMEKRRLIMRKEVPPKDFDLDGGLSSSGIATQIATLKALQSYGDILNKLVLNDQSDAISKAATDFMTQYETARQLNDASYSLEEEKKSAITGILNTANSWFIEHKKKSSLKSIVKTYSTSIESLAALLKNDLVLTGYSLCLIESDKKENQIKTGVIDIYCTSSDGLREISKDVLKNKKYSFSEREFAYNSFVMSEKAVQEVRGLSKNGEKLVNKLIKANNQLSKVIETEEYTAEDIREYANQVEELITLTKILTGK
jgi:hypothetical protein